MKKYSLYLLFFSFSSLAAIMSPSEKSHVSIEIDYTMGEHLLEAKGISGKVEWDPTTSEIKSGELKMAIANIKSQKSELECHMRESLGLDYLISNFPKDHVCNEEDKLPNAGPNSIKYPEISATLLSVLKVGENEAKVQWIIHGKKSTLTMPITVTKGKEGEVLKMNSKWNMKLSDFNIIVKKFLFIGVKDDVELKLDASFQ
jgi:polyisoprenoid-binding protein YceI